MLEESSEGASLLDGFSLVDASEEEGIAEFGTWLEEGACSDGVWLERVCVCWVAAAGCSGSGSGSCAGCSTFTLVTKSPEPD